MGNVSMKGAAGVNLGGELGKSGTVKLTELNTKDSGQSEEAGGVDGYRRNYDDGNDYLRVNPFAVQQGYAPDPDSNSAPFNLHDWDGYDQWSETWSRGTNFDVTNITTTTVAFAFTYAAGYTRDTNSLTQRLYYKACGSECTDDDDPRSGGQSTDGPADSSTYTLSSGLSANTKYIFCIVAVHNQDGIGSGGTAQESELYAAKSTVTNGTKIEDTNESGQYIWVTTAQNCVAYSVGLGSSADGCDEWLDESDTCSNYNASTVYANTALGTGVVVYSNNACTNTVTSSYIAIQGGGCHVVRQLNNGQISGSPNNECCC